MTCYSRAAGGKLAFRDVAAHCGEPCQGWSDTVDVDGVMKVARGEVELKLSRS